MSKLRSLARVICSWTLEISGSKIPLGTLNMDKKPFIVKSCLRDLAKCKNIVSKLRSSLNPYKNNDPEWQNKELLDKVKRIQRDLISEENSCKGVDQLINNLDLGFADPKDNFNPENDDLGEWFSGAPSWLGRS